MTTQDQITINVVTLFDGKLSIRLDNEEVAILPTRQSTSVYDMEQMVAKVVRQVVDWVQDPEWYATEDGGWG